MYAATLFGPSYDTSNGHDAENIEVFGTVGQAIEAMFDRHRAHGRRPLNVDVLTGYSMALTFPAFTEGTAMQLYDIGSLLPRRKNLPAVIERINSGQWDWYLILEHNGSDIYVRTHRA
jgi:hypothetical protein